MGTILWIANNSTQRCERTNKMPSLARMQAYVGGYVELVRVLHNDKPCIMFVNEEGALPKWPDRPLPVNEYATRIYHAATLKRIRQSSGEIPFRGMRHPIHGPAVLIEDINEESEDAMA